MTTSDIFYNHPKVKEARNLLLEADQDIRMKQRAEIAAHECQCGHRRDRHTDTYSVNYTGGACRDCKCLNYLWK